MTLFNKLSVTNFTASTIPDDFLKGFAHHQKITRKWVRTDAGWELEDASILREWDAEKRIWIAFQMTIALIAAVLVIYFLKDSPAILISILYTAGLLIAFNIWNKHKDGRSPKDQ